MPAKRKADGQTSGNAKKSTLGTKYGGGVKKYRDKYASKDIDWDIVAKLADNAASKQINKNIETQYSQALVSLLGTASATTGWALGPLNVGPVAGPNNTTVTGFVPDQALIFNLGYLSGVGPSNTPGYRLGQRINAKYIKCTVAANLPEMSADCTYHWRVVRRKTDQAGQLSYSQPSLVPMSTLSLYKPLTDGPLASSASYGTYSSSTSVFASHSSAMRQNTDQWTFCKNGSASYSLIAAPIDTDATDGRLVRSFCKSLHFEVNAEWDFVTRGGSDIKGGNYFFVMWREGGPDYTSQQASTSSAAVSAMGGLSLKVFFELAYKDG